MVNHLKFTVLFFKNVGRKHLLVWILGSFTLKLVVFNNYLYAFLGYCNSNGFIWGWVELGKPLHHKYAHAFMDSLCYARRVGEDSFLLFLRRVQCSMQTVFL